MMTTIKSRELTDYVAQLLSSTVVDGEPVTVTRRMTTTGSEVINLQLPGGEEFNLTITRARTRSRREGEQRD